MRIFNGNPRILAYMGAADALTTLVAHQNFSEYTTKFFEEVLKMGRYIPRMRDNEVLRPGCYTEETEMALAMAQLITCKNLRVIIQHDFVDAFITAYTKGDRQSDYLKMQYGFNNAANELWHPTGKPINSISLTFVGPFDSYGILAPAVICGVIEDVTAMISCVDALCLALDFSDEYNRSCARYIALLSHFAHHEIDSFTEFFSVYCGKLERYIPYSYVRTFQFSQAKGWALEENTLGIVSLVGALLTKDFTLHSLLQYCTQVGGRCDTAATVALGIASARCIDEVLPEFLMRDLENVDFLLQQGEQLMKKFS